MEINIKDNFKNHFINNFINNTDFSHIKYIFISFDFKNKISFLDLNNEQIFKEYPYSQVIGHICHHFKIGLISKILNKYLNPDEIIIICDPRLIFLFTNIFKNIISIYDFDYSLINEKNSVFMFTSMMYCIYTVRADKYININNKLSLEFLQLMDLPVKQVLNNKFILFHIRVYSLIEIYINIIKNINKDIDIIIFKSETNNLNMEKFKVLNRKIYYEDKLENFLTLCRSKNNILTISPYSGLIEQINYTGSYCPILYLDYRNLEKNCKYKNYRDSLYKYSERYKLNGKYEKSFYYMYPYKDNKIRYNVNAADNDYLVKIQEIINYNIAKILFSISLYSTNRLKFL